MLILVCYQLKAHHKTRVHSLLSICFIDLNTTKNNHVRVSVHNNLKLELPTEDVQV